MNRTLVLFRGLSCKCGKKCSPDVVWEKIKVMSGIDQYESPKVYRTSEFWTGPECERQQESKYIEGMRWVTLTWSKIDPSLVKYCKKLKD